MKKIYAILISYIRECKEKSRRRQEEDVVRNFYIEENHGAIYIMCNGIAIKTINHNVEVQVILDFLAEARSTALMYVTSDYTEKVVTA